MKYTKYIFLVSINSINNLMCGKEEPIEKEKSQIV